MSNLREFSVGTRLFCDFPFGGKPKGVCLAVLEPGNGKNTLGKVRVRLTESAGAYRKGEELEVSTFTAVPLVMERALRKGEYVRRISTLYSWISHE